MDELERYRQSREKPAGKPQPEPPGRSAGLRPAPARTSPFFDLFSNRACITICSPAPGRSCRWEEDRRELTRALCAPEITATIGNMKTCCDGECASGPLVGFPQKQFFYIGVFAGSVGAVIENTLGHGRILFDLLSVNSLRSYRSDVYYDPGTGFLAAIDDRVCMVDVAKYFLRFEEGVTCGKCVPCRIGVERALEIVGRLIDGRGKQEELEYLKTLCAMMDLTPDCEYASSAMRPLKSILTCFWQEFPDHLEGKCSAGVCRLSAD